MPTDDAPKDLSTAELFAAARTEVADAVPDEPVPYLIALHDRPTREVFDGAVRLLADDDPVARELGARILRELGPYDQDGRRPFSDAAIPVLVDRLGTESDPRVLGWIISALGYNWA